MVKGGPAYPVRSALMVVAIIIASSLVVGASAKLAYASSTFIVNSTGNENDSDFPSGTFDGSSDGTCDVGTGLCTLRAAIQEANVTAGSDTINFNISGPGCVDGVCTIGPFELPLITDTVIINGYTQGDGTPGDPSDDAKPNTLAVGNNAELKIKLDGTEAGNGLKIEADNSTVKGLVISNWDNGIFLGVDATGNTVRGNFIGTDASGSNLSNNIGIALTNALNNTIGGTSAAARNLISDNGAGISMSGGSDNMIQGNYIGTNAAGDARLGNNQGVALSNAQNNTVGGTTAAERNIISGNGTWGVRISDAESMRNKVQGNYIGTDVTGTVTDPDGTPDSGDELGNGLNGVLIQTGAHDNTIGGTAAGASNIISGNGNGGADPLQNTLSGVEIQFANTDLPSKATGNRILSNSIYDNVKLGIDLYYTNDPPGVTCNDDDPPPDSDDGPNHLQNFPEITSARLTTRRIGEHRRKVTLVRGTLDSTPSTATTTQTFTLQFFGSPEADDTPSICAPSGFGEGKRFLGQESVITDSSGNANFTFMTRKKVPKGQVVTATATDRSTGDTSEFSQAAAVN
jgi:CSLREA domain-containing protein